MEIERLVNLEGVSRKCGRDVLPTWLILCIREPDLGEMPNPIKITIIEGFHHIGSVSILDRTIAVRKHNDPSMIHGLNGYDNFVDHDAFQLLHINNRLESVR